MAELRGDGGARLIEEKPQMGFDFLTPKFVNLLTPLSLFGAKRYLHYICLLKSFLCHSKTTTWTGGPVLETCCEKNKCKIHQIAILPKEGQRNWKNKIEFIKWDSPQGVRKEQEKELPWSQYPWNSLITILSFILETHLPRKKVEMEARDRREVVEVIRIQRDDQMFTVCWSEVEWRRIWSQFLYL